MWLQMALFLRLSSIPFYTSFYPFVCQWTVRLFHVLAFELASFAARHTALSAGTCSFLKYWEALCARKSCKGQLIRGHEPANHCQEHLLSCTVYTRIQVIGRGFQCSSRYMPFSGRGQRFLMKATNSGNKS